MICTNCMLMAFDDPLQDPPSRILRIFGTTNSAFTFIFVVEMLVQMTAANLYGHPRSYLADSFNRLDLALIIASLFDFSTAYIGLSGAPSFLTAFRVLRVMKLLRLVTRIPALRQIILVILHSLPAMLNTLVLCMTLGLSFCLVGSSLFGGKLQGVCFDADTGLPAAQPCVCQRFFTTSVSSSLDGYYCLDVPPQGVTTAPNFERIAHSAVISMSQIATLDSWAVAMTAVMGVEGYVAEAVYFAMVIALPTFCCKLFVAQTIHSYQIIMGMDARRQAQTLPAIRRIQHPVLARALAGMRASVRALVAANTTPRFLGVFGEARVNVLALNLAMDQASGVVPAAAPAAAPAPADAPAPAPAQ